MPLKSGLRLGTIGSGGIVESVNGKTGVVTLNSSEIPETAPNLYFNQTNFDNAFALKSTTDLAEGTNLYYTEARVSANVDVSANTAKVSADGSIDTHSDVNTTSIPPSNGQVLTWDGIANWIPKTPIVAPVDSVNGQTGVVVLDTDDIAEGVSNFYYTEGRFDTSFSGKDTDDLSEGVTNLYYTEARFNTSLSNSDTDDLSEGAFNFYFTNARFDTALGNSTTDGLPEGVTNLYYTEARVSANADVAANTAKVSADGSVDTHSDVDTSTTLPVLGQYLAWDNINWVPTTPAMAPVTSVNGQTGVVVLDTDDIAEGVSNFYYTEARFDTSFSGKDTDDLAEGVTNLYYTQARFDSAFAAKDTDDLSEGALNLYYTTARFDLDFAAKDTDDLSEGAVNFYYTEARFDSSFSGKTTTDLTEGTNLYYTEARVSANVDVAANTAKVSADGSVDTHSDVDTTSVLPAVGQVLTWDTSNWVPQTPASAPVDSVNGQTGVVVLDTDDIAEGAVNFYYTEARFDSSFSGKTTTDLTEGTNLYYTQARFDSAFTAKDTDDLSEGAVNFYYTTGRFDTDFATKTTDDLPEGITNLYYTEARVSANSSVVANTAKVSADGSIDTHSDVDLTGLVSGQVLRYDGVNFVPYTQPGPPVTSVNGQTGAVVLDTDDVSEGVTNLYYTQARFDSAFTAKTTTDLTEGTNLYYTQARFDSAFTAKDSDDLSEGVVNFYYTEARFDSSFSGKTTTDLTEGTNLYYTQARFDSAFAAKTTTDLTEGTNLYYTQARFDSAFAAKSTTDLTEGTNLYYTQARFDSAFSAKTTTDLTEGTNLYYTEARVSANTSVVANTAKVSADGSIDTHSDVDTTTTLPVIDNSLLWDGSNWVPGPGLPYQMFTEDFSTITTDATGAWVTRTLTGFENQVVFIMLDNDSNGTRIIGVRESGSALARNKSVDKNTSPFNMPVKTNSSGQIEIFSDGNDVIFTILGGM